MARCGKQTQQQQRLVPPTDQRTNPFQRQLRPSMTTQKNAHGWLASHNGGLLFRKGLWGNSLILLCRRICRRDSKSLEFIVLQYSWNNDISNHVGGCGGLGQKDAKSLQLSWKIIFIDPATLLHLPQLPFLIFLFSTRLLFLKAVVCVCGRPTQDAGWRSLCFLKTEIIRNVKSNGQKRESSALIKDLDHIEGSIGKSGKDLGMETRNGCLFVLSCRDSCNVMAAVEPVKLTCLISADGGQFAVKIHFWWGSLTN